MDTKHQFFQRQFAMAVKLLRNLLSWQGLLGDTQLKNLALGSLLNRYLLAGLRVSIPNDALFKANMVCLCYSFEYKFNIAFFKSSNIIKYLKKTLNVI